MLLSCGAKETETGPMLGSPHLGPQPLASTNFAWSFLHLIFSFSTPIHFLRCEICDERIKGCFWVSLEWLYGAQALSSLTIFICKPIPAQP